MNLLILGMPNVGKSSLYNILCDKNDNIIHKSVGTTRDWHEGLLKHNKNVIIFDTPGIIINKKINLDSKIQELIKSIDTFLYVIDYHNNVYDNDRELLNFLRKYNKEIILIINKDDNYNQDKNIKSFGFKNNFFISCSHKLGIEDLTNFLLQLSPNTFSTKKIKYSIGLFGKTNVGKSTLLNKLVGFERSIVSKRPKTTTDIVSSTYEFNENIYSIKDTAGLLKKNKIDKDSLDYFATKKTLSIINNLDLNIFLIDIKQGFDNQSKKIFNIIYQKSNIILLLINKIDLININKKIVISELKKDIEAEFSQSKNIYILPISALNENDVLNLKKFIHKLTFDIKINITTSKLNKWLKIIKPHSRIRGKEVKFKYATQILENPLTIKIFANFSKEITSQYKRYLLNNFYDYFKIKSKKVKIILTKNSNPFD